MNDKIPSLEMVVENPRQDEEKSVKDSVLEITLKELFSFEKLEMKTDLSEPLILAMSRGMIFSKRYKSSTMLELIVNIQKLSVSKDRKGRGELVELVRNAQDPIEDGEAGIMRRLFSGS